MDTRCISPTMLMIFTMTVWNVLNPIHSRKSRKKERMTERAFPECRRYILSQNSAFFLISQWRRCNRCLEVFSTFFSTEQKTTFPVNPVLFCNTFLTLLCLHVSLSVLLCLFTIVFLKSHLTSGHWRTLQLVPNWWGMPQWVTDFTFQFPFTNTSRTVLSSLREAPNFYKCLWAFLKSLSVFIFPVRGGS